MKHFKTFLKEDASKEEKLKHLEHAEDHHINAGEEGFNHAFRTLDETDKMLAGERSKASVSTKFDGSPSVVFGTNPDNGKFFVSSKSAFNKDPKLNYTPEDIQANHGHAPGLVDKLKAALEHLPKVTPKEGVYQGDFMYSKDDGDVKEDEDGYHFKPNTITYSVDKNSEEGDKVKNAKIGVAVHTHYHGDNLADMRAQYNKGSEGFGEHPDVDMVSTNFDPKSANYTPDIRRQFRQHMYNAMEEHSSMPDYKHHEGHEETMKTYINSTVRNDTTPTASGYRDFMFDRLKKEVDKVTSDKAKEAKQQKLFDAMKHIDANKEKFDKSFKIHKHIQAAKNVLVNALAGAKQVYKHTIDGKDVKPEGHVVAIDNRPTKLTDRHEFNKLNFAARPR